MKLSIVSNGTTPAASVVPAYTPKVEPEALVPVPVLEPGPPPPPPTPPTPLPPFALKVPPEAVPLVVEPLEDE